MKVSVIIPTYQRTELLLTRCLPSVLEQTHTDLEILVIGDGTEQATVDAMANHPDPRVKFWNLPHQKYPEEPGDKWCVLGLEALNFGLDQATGEWIAAVADDDCWALNAVESLLAKAIAENVDFVYGKSITPWGQTYGRWPPSSMNFTDGSYVYRNGMGYRYDKTCLDRGLPEDADLWVRMIQGGVTFAFLDQLVYLYFPNPR